MSVFAGPEISQSGLVFAFDIGNTNKSWKGAPITNEAKNASNQIDWGYR
jgi:outer membrane protein assembly factor BamB